MDVSGVSSAGIQQLGTVQSAAQVAVLKKTEDLQAEQVAQLLKSVPKPAESGQPGGVINIFA